MKVHDIWENDPEAIVNSENPSDDKQRKAWYHEIKVIQTKMQLMIAKLDAEGKLPSWSDPGFDRESNLEFTVHQGPIVFFHNNEEGVKLKKDFERLEARRARLADLLLKDMADRGAPKKK